LNLNVQSHSFLIDVFSIAAVTLRLGRFVLGDRVSPWLAAPDSLLEPALSASRFWRDWFAGPPRLLPLSGARPFSWNYSQFGQPLPQLAADWEEPSAFSHFFSNTRWLAEGTRLILVHYLHHPDIE